MERRIEHAGHQPKRQQALDEHTESASLEIKGGRETGELAIVDAAEPERVTQGGFGHEVFALLMGADKAPLREETERFCRRTCRAVGDSFFAQVRCSLVEDINDVVESGPRIEKANRQRLPVKGISVQIEWIPELALDAPEAIGGPIRHFAF